MGMNRVNLVGRLTKDVELRKTQSGLSVTICNIAFDSNGKDANGNYGTLFIDIKIFGRVAEVVASNCIKGSSLAVDGRLNYQEYERKDGTKAKKWEVIADNVSFFNKAAEKANEEREKQKVEVVRSEPIEETEKLPFDIDDLEDDDLPF